MGAGGELCSPFMGVLVGHGGGPLLALVWAIVGMGGVWRWPSLALIGSGGGSSPLVVLPCVAACNRRCMQSSSCYCRVFVTFPRSVVVVSYRRSAVVVVYRRRLSSSSVIVVHRCCVVAGFCRRCVVPL